MIFSSTNTTIFKRLRVFLKIFILNSSLIEFEDKESKNNNESDQTSQLIDINPTVYNEDDINAFIDQMANNEAINLNEQLKELEMLEKLKKDNSVASKKQISSSNSMNTLNQNDFDNEPTISQVDENLFKTTNDEFEKEWQSAFTLTSLTTTSTTSTPAATVPARTNSDNFDDLFSPQNTNSVINNTGNGVSQADNNNSFFKTFLPSQLLTKKVDNNVLQPQKPQVKSQDTNNKANKTSTNAKVS